MDLLSPIKDHHSERRVFLGRVILTGVVGIILLGIVIARLVQLQVFDYEHFAERSLGNRIRIEAVPPIRGLVFDRQGRVLAENMPAYQLELIPEQVPDIDTTLERLAGLELIDPSDIQRIKDLSQTGPRFKPVALNPRLDDEQIARFAIQRPRFPGVDFRPRLVRHYPVTWGRSPPRTSRNSIPRATPAPRRPARPALKTVTSRACTATPVFGTL